MHDLIAVVNKWPDSCEIRQEGDDETSREAVLIVNRRNSYPLHDGLKLMLQLFEDKGVKVFIRVGGVDLTMEEFERNGAFVAQPSKTAASKQGMYNLRSQLKKLIELGLTIPEDSPQYAVIARRVSNLRAMLSSIEPDVHVDEAAVQKSAEGLKRLEQLMKEELKNATRKPDVAGEVRVDEGTSPQFAESVVVSPKLESD